MSSLSAASRNSLLTDPLLLRNPTSPPPVSPRSPRLSMSDMTPAQILRTFVTMALSFALNHGAVIACLDLSSSRFGSSTSLGADLGTWQSGTLYISYTLSALLGASHCVRLLGSRDGLFLGLSLYCLYVGCFLAATLSPALQWPLALIGAAVGGVGGGLLWTSQGAYFAVVSAAYANAAGVPQSSATSYLSGVFAFFSLSIEVVLKMLSTVITNDDWGFGMEWWIVFLVYTVLAVAAAAGMLLCHKFPPEKQRGVPKPLFYKLTAATRLLAADSKMKYMLPTNVLFGFAASFVTLYVSGQVLDLCGVGDYIGFITAIPALVAALLNLILGPLSARIGKVPILVFGAFSFSLIGIVFLIFPSVSSWGWGPVVAVYILMGCGRATFEGPLRASFADLFTSSKEEAFANIILQSGLASALGFFGFPHFSCGEETKFCVKFQDGTLHNVMALEIILIVTAIIAILGNVKASRLHRKELDEEEERRNLYGRSGMAGAREERQ